MNKNNRFTCIFAFVAVGFCTPAVAQNQIDGSAARTLEEIVITARKKEESLLDAPLSVSAVTGVQLDRAGIDSFNQVLNTIPNTGQAGGIAGNIQGLITIRGISTLIRFLGLETGVGFYVDGVYQGRPQNFNQDLLDIERIEVLRGPQGALFGKNTIAGAINIITRKPGNDLNAAIEAQFGNFGHTRVEGAISGSLAADTLAGSLSIGVHQRDPFVDNVNGPGVDDADLITYRGKLRFTPNDEVELIFSADGLRDRSNTLLFEVEDFNFGLFPGIDSDPSVGTPYLIAANQPNYAHRDVWGVSATGVVKTGSGEWTGILAYRDAGFDAALDDDQLPIRVFPDFFDQSTESFAAELRYAQDVSERMNYLIGAYYDRQDSTGFGDFAVGEDFHEVVFGTRLEPPIILNTTMDSASIALFFDVNYALTEKVWLEVGGRWVTEDKSAVHDQDDRSRLFVSTLANLDRSDSDFSPTVSLTYDISDAATAYLRYAQGFKSAGFNLDFITDPTSLEVAPEKATAYEIGLKSRLLNDKLTLNMAAFSTDYKDLQLAQIVGAGVIVANAANAEISGVEADFNAILGDYIDINGGIGYLDASYEDFAGCPVPGAAAPSVVSANCGGNFLNLAPKWTASIGAQLRYPIQSGLDLIARLDWNYRSDVFFEPQNDPRLRGRSRDLINARIGLVKERWEVFAWALNAADELYVNYSDDRSIVGSSVTRAYGAPRTYGLTARLSY